MKKKLLMVLAIGGASIFSQTGFSGCKPCTMELLANASTLTWGVLDSRKIPQKTSFFITS